jgi:hypothetical protein
MIESDYAKALYATNPGMKELSNLRAALKRRGHEKLLPRIYSEYKKLLLADQRRARAAEVTPEAERTRVLLELYRALTKH